MIGSEYGELDDPVPAPLVDQVHVVQEP